MSLQTSGSYCRRRYTCAQVHERMDTLTYARSLSHLGMFIINHNKLGYNMQTVEHIHILREMYFRGQTFGPVIWTGIIYSTRTHAVRTHASACAAAGIHEPTCMNW